jgi:hypothetical protein
MAKGLISTGKLFWIQEEIKEACIPGKIDKYKCMIKSIAKEMF